MAEQGEELVERLRQARRQLLDTVAGLDDLSLRRRPAAGEWSVIEVLAHIPDADAHYLTQAQFIHARPDYCFVYFDAETWKKFNSSAITRPLQEVLASLNRVHSRVIGWTATLSADDLERTGLHPYQSSITVRKVLERIASHDLNHREQIMTIRKVIGAGDP